MSTVETIATEAGVVSGLVESITTSMHHIDDIYAAPIEEGDTFVDYQTRMVTAAKEIARLAQDMVCDMNIAVKRKSTYQLTI